MTFMKKMSKMLLVAVAILATFSLNAKNGEFKVCDGKVTVNVEHIAETLDSKVITADYSFIVAPDVIADCESMIITTSIVNGANKDVINVSVINGKNVKRFDKWLQYRIGEVTDIKNVDLYNIMSTENVVTEQKKLSTPRQEWMDGADFVVTTQRVSYHPHRCIQALGGSEVVCKVPFLRVPLYLAPKYEKLVDKKFVRVPVPNEGDPKLATRLFFPNNSSAKVPDLFDNQATLEMLETLQESEYLTVKSIDIQGWASPEATVSYNQSLSERRAKTVKDILAKKYNFDDAIYTTSGNGEYWDAVINYVKTTDNETVAASREDIINAIESNDNLDKRESAIKAIKGGKPYREIFNAVYPESRFSDCYVTFAVKEEYKYEDALVLMSADEIHLPGSAYKVILLETKDMELAEYVSDLYPDHTLVQSLVGELYVEKGQFAKAIEHFKKAGDYDLVNNDIACCYFWLGDYENAYKYFEKAKALKSYEYNMNQTRRLELNKTYYK